MTNLIFRRLFTVLTLLLAKVALPQNATPNREFKPQEVTLPQTPEVKGLFEYSQFPVDHSSGAANIEVPFYTINSGRIQLPISASYSTGGIRVQDIASMIGLGWNLNFGYSIRVNEEETKIYPYETKLYKTELAALAATNRSTMWVEEMKNSADGYFRSMHTIYDFRCGAMSGAFYYDDNNQLQLLSPNDNLKIEAINYASTASQMGGFKITTAEGIEYVFDKRETTMRQEQSYPGPTLQTTAFWVSKITDLISGDKVSFEYNQKDPYSSFQNESNRSIYQGNYPSAATCSWSEEGPSFSSIPFQVNALQIASISFSGGHINFRSTKDRLDIDKTRITAVDIYSDVWPGVLLKTVKFNHSYFISGGNIAKYNYRLRLDSLTIQNSETSLTDKNTYTFEYDSTTLPPYRQKDSREHNSFMVDYWGFFNGKYGGDGLTPRKVVVDFLAMQGYTNKSPIFTTDRAADATYTKAGILNKVIYPTGGYARFEYENHQLPGYYLGTTLGGLRIKNISYYADKDDVKPIEKTFNYLSVKELTPSSINTFWYSKTKSYTENYGPYPHQICVLPYQMHYISSDPLYSFVYHHGSPVFYDKVEEYNGNLLKNEGKTIYTFKFSGTNHNDYTLSSIKEYAGRRLVHVNDWTRGQLLSKEVYKRNSESNGAYILVEKEVNSYGKGYSRPRAHLGLMISKNDQSSTNVGPSTPNYSWDLVGPSADTYYINESYNGRMPVDAFVYNDISVFRDYSRLSKQETFRYEGAESLYTYTDYYYDSPYHEQVSKIESGDSYGNINTRKFYYIQDQSSISDVTSSELNTAFPLLRQSNKMSDVIQEDRLLNGKLQVRNRAKFTFRYSPVLSKNIPLMQQYSSTSFNTLGTAVQTDDIKFNMYDNRALLLEKQEGNGILRSYIWDDAGVTLVAKVDNAAYSDICQTSFEYGGKGKWVYGGSRTVDADAVTGGYSYTLTANYPLSAVGLGASKRYIVSYWSTNGSYSVSGTNSVVEGRSLGNWKYYEHIVTGVSTVAISGAGKIDEVRLYPENAQMTSYTTIPMIGTSSICDPNSTIIYYSYDGLGKLMLIRDLDKNIIQRICYKFYDQPEDCTETYK